MEKKINNGFAMPIVFKTMIEQGDESFKSFFKLGVDQALKHFNKGIKKYEINNFGFEISKNSNDKFTLNVEINEQDISNIDINLLITYLEQYKHDNQIAFEEIIIDFNSPIINQQIFDLIQDKTQDIVEINNANGTNENIKVELNFTRCGLRNVDLTQYTVEELNEMKFLSEVAKFNDCKINIKTLETILIREFYSRKTGNLSKLDISKISIEDINQLDKNLFKDKDQLKLVKLSKKQVKKILKLKDAETFLGRTKGDLSGFDLSGLDLIGLYFGEANLTDTNLTNTKIVYNSLAGANLRGANIGKFNICIDPSKAIPNIHGHPEFLEDHESRYVRNVKISREHVKEILTTDGFLARKKGDLSNFDLSGLDLSGLNFEGANLTNTNLTNANLTDTNLNNVKISKEQVETILNLEEGKTFLGRTKGDLHGFDLRGFGLRGHDLFSAHLSGLNLNGLNFDGVNLIGVKIHQKQVEAILNLEEGKTFLGRTKGDLYGFNLEGIDLIGANLVNANLTDTNLTNAKLTGAKLSKEQVEKILNLEEGKTFLGRTKGDLREFDLSKSDLNGLNFENAKLKGAKLSKEQVEKILNLEEGKTFLGRKKGDLSDFNLNNIDFSNIEFDNINLRNTSLSQAQMICVVKKHINNLNNQLNQSQDLEKKFEKLSSIYWESENISKIVACRKFENVEEELNALLKKQSPELGFQCTLL